MAPQCGPVCLHIPVRSDCRLCLSHHRENPLEYIDAFHPESFRGSRVQHFRNMYLRRNSLSASGLSDPKRIIRAQCISALRRAHLYPDSSDPLSDKEALTHITVIYRLSQGGFSFRARQKQIRRFPDLSFGNSEITCCQL